MDQNKEEIVNQLMIVLEAHFSAPGAAIYVSSFVKPLSDSDFDLAYEIGEGANDAYTERILCSMNDYQMDALMLDLIDLSDNDKKDIDDETWLDCYAHTEEIIEGFSKLQGLS